MLLFGQGKINEVRPLDSPALVETRLLTGYGYLTLQLAKFSRGRGFSVTEVTGNISQSHKHLVLNHSLIGRSELTVSAFRTLRVDQARKLTGLDMASISGLNQLSEPRLED